MAYDLAIRGGTVVDGTGAAGYRADVGIRAGRVAAIGRLDEAAKSTVDAEGHVVSPGFVDGHTHMDAQVFWDPLGSCSCYHGVTSVVMGNCGFTLAPCAEEDADLVFRNLERAEDISREAMLAGVRWRWESYPEYLDAVEAVPKGINYAGYLGHSALRTHVMGARAFEEQASAEEVARMARLAAEAVRAGAMGFTTSRSPNHETSDRKPVASRVASWEEVRAIVAAVGETGAGLFEIAGEAVGQDPERIADYHGRLKALAVETAPAAGGAAGQVRGSRDQGEAGGHCQRPERPPQGPRRGRQAAGLGLAVRDARHRWARSERRRAGGGARRAAGATDDRSRP